MPIRVNYEKEGGESREEGSEMRAERREKRRE